MESKRGAPSRVDRRRDPVLQRERQRRQRIALGFIGFFLLIVTGIIIVGYVAIFVLPPQQLVVKVNDVEYTRGDMVKLLRVRQKGAEFFGGKFSTSTEIFQSLQNLVESEIISQSAPSLGITVSEEEVKAEIRDLIAPRPDGSKTPKQLEREFREIYTQYLNAIQLSESEHQDLIRMSMLRERFRQYIGESVPSIAEHVHLYRVTMAPTDPITIMLDKFKDSIGDAKDPENLQALYKDIVREFSRDDPETVRKGGEVGWITRGIFEQFDGIIFDLEPGELSQSTNDIDNPANPNLIFFMITERQTAREIDSFSREQLKTNALQDWLNQERENHEVFALFNSDIYNWMIEQLGLTTIITPTPRPQSPLQQLGF